MDYSKWIGRDALDENNDKVGTIEHLYMDGETDEPKWATIKSGFWGTKTHFVPIALAEQSDEGVCFRTTKDAINEAPAVEEDGELSPEEQARLYKHYRGYQQAGVSDDEDGDAAGTVGHDVSGPTTDDAMTRSEEEVTVGKREQEVGRARLRKYVVTEDVTMTVPVEKEKVRLEREPITDENFDSATSGPDISEEEHEVVLKEEVPVIEKKTVPKERVRLGKETVTEEHEVSEQVRKEQIDIDGEPNENR